MELLLMFLIIVLVANTSYRYGQYFAKPLSKEKCVEDLREIREFGVINEFQEAYIIKRTGLKEDVK